MIDDPIVRLRALRDRVRATGGAGATDDARLAAYAEKVARHAYKITDEEVAALLAAGHSQDDVFELTVVTALGSAIDQMEAGLAALAQAEVE